MAHEMIVLFFIDVLIHFNRNLQSYDIIVIDRFIRIVIIFNIFHSTIFVWLLSKTFIAIYRVSMIKK